MNHGSLFSGIGGFDLAAEWMNWENLFHVEIDPFCRQILNYYWPKAISYDNIKETDFTVWRGRIDILTGGFPCQPYSAAGLRRGKEDERHLWPEMLRAIREIKPRWVVAENVYGLISWDKGLVFKEVQTDLENEGYEVQPVILPAAGINAPHIRQRVWFIAYAGRNGRTKDTPVSDRENDYKKIGKKIYNTIDGFSVFGTTPDTTSIGRRKKKHRYREAKLIDKNGKDINWENFPTQSPICSGNDGIPNQLDGITLSKHRKKSIEGFGNAIVPQLVLPILEVIEDMDKTFTE